MRNRVLRLVLFLAALPFFEGHIDILTYVNISICPPSSSAAVTDAGVPAGRLAILDRERSSLKSLAFTATVETPKPGGRTGRSSLKFDFEAASRPDGRGGPDKSSRYRSEIRMGLEGTLLTVADGVTIWSWMSRTRKLYRQDQALATERLGTYGPVDPVTALATPSVPLSTLFRALSARDSGGVSFIELEPRRSVPNYDRLLVITSRDGKTLLGAETFQRGGLTARIVINGWHRNIARPPGLFTFTPPSGVRAVEIR